MNNSDIIVLIPLAAFFVWLVYRLLTQKGCGGKGGCKGCSSAQGGCCKKRGTAQGGGCCKSKGKH